MGVAAPPRVFHPGIVHLALAVGGFAIGTTEFATMSLLPYFSRDLGISAPVAGHVISAYALGVVLGAPLTHSETGKGVARTTEDGYFKECKLNELASLSYDASGLVVSMSEPALS